VKVQSFDGNRRQGQASEFKIGKRPLEKAVVSYIRTSNIDFSSVSFWGRRKATEESKIEMLCSAQHDVPRNKGRVK